VSIGGAIVSIVSFAIVTGASATTLRASIMALIVVVAWSARLNYSVHRSLWCAAFLMVFQNPMILVYDPGFQLSFVATLGLLHVAPHIDGSLTKIKIPARFGVREIVSATMATQLTVLPLLIQMTGSVSLISLLANMLVIPMVPFAMLVSALAGATHILGFIGLPFAFVSSYTLKYMIVVAEALAEVPYAVLTF
jgi:competence protein ComEC